MHIRSLKIEDAPYMYEWMHDTTVVDHLYTDFAGKTMSDCCNFIVSSWTDPQNKHFAIADENDEYQGTVSLKNIVGDNAEFAITIRAGAMGKGFSWFGMHSVLDMAFFEMNIKTVYWCVADNNIRAIRFYDKHGFIKTRDIPVSYMKNYSDTMSLIWYSIDSECWRKQ